MQRPPAEERTKLVDFIQMMKTSHSIRKDSAATRSQEPSQKLTSNRVWPTLLIIG